MHVVGQEGSLDTTEHGVDDNTQRKEETGCCGWNASQGGNDSRSTGEQHGRDQSVGEEAECDVDEMRGWSIASADSFQECLDLC